MHRGHILAEGSLAELIAAHDEHDLEELFFQLITKHDEVVERQTDPVA